MTTINKKVLEAILRGIGKQTPYIGLNVVTETKGRKGFGTIVKQCKITGRAGAFYRNATGPRKWGERIPDTPLVQHKGNLYLELEVTHIKDEEFFDKERDIPIDKDEAIERGYRDRPIKEGEQSMRDYKLESIKAIRLNGEEYYVT